MTVLSIAATAVVIVTIGAELAGRLSRKTASGILALAFTAGSIAASSQGIYVVAYLHAALAAWHAWLWWHNGGGDDTKRRLRKAAARFQPVRRTAPAT